MALFRDYIARRYYAVGIGGALLEWGSRGVLLVAPFIIAFVLGNLWLKDAAFWHQPNVTWPAKALLVVQGANPVLDLPQAVGWTSVDAANEFLGPSLVVPHFEVLTTDGNGDGWADWLDFRLAVPLPDAFEPTDLQLLLVLRYRVEAEVRLDLEVPAHLHLRPPPGATACQSQGTLRFRQRYPLFWNVLQPNASYFPSASTTGISQLLLPPLLGQAVLTAWRWALPVPVQVLNAMYNAHTAFHMQSSPAIFSQHTCNIFTAHPLFVFLAEALPAGFQ